MRLNMAVEYRNELQKKIWVNYMNTDYYLLEKNRRCILVAMFKSSLTHRTVIKEEEKDH